MKTQITDLINGTRDIRRDLSNPKYIDCPKATSHIGYVGTNFKLRAEIAEKVIAENPDGMDVEMFGKKFHLSRSSSLSGKTVWFSTEITLMTSCCYPAMRQVHSDRARNLNLDWKLTMI